MNKYSNTELILILAHYVFKNCQLPLFRQRLKQYLNKEYSEADLLYVESLFSIIDPSNNRDRNSVDSKLIDLWNKYSSDEGRKNLRAFYNQFNAGKLVTYNIQPIEPLELGEPTISFANFIDKPEPIPDYEINNGAKEYKRNQSVVSNALAFAKYMCENNCSNNLFMRKNKPVFYTEAHHLIPLKFQEYFETSLDVEANVISLCPMCHRLIHHGLNNDKVIEKLYKNRKSRLKKCDINITLEQLLFFYQ